MNKRSYPEDNSNFTFGVAADFEHSMVIISFGKPIAWLGFPPELARKLAALLIKKAEEIEKGRLQ